MRHQCNNVFKHQANEIFPVENEAFLIGNEVLPVENETFEA